MNETRRTVIYVAVALVSVALAWWLSPPVEITPKELADANVGTKFYPNFTDPNEPTSIRVVSYDEAKATVRPFAVELRDGKWTIPSHHNYPADGADRLAKTSASAIGIKRDEFASDSKQFHEQFGVVDPLDEDQGRLKGRGQRITLSKGSNVLMDLIVGKAVKDRPGFHYVRKPDEDATYASKLDIDLSTKFKDWVETDLLKLNRDDLKEIVLDHYSVDESQGAIIPGEIDTLQRDKPADPWKIVAVDAEKKPVDVSKDEVDVSKVNGMLGALDELKLVGVRPKPKGLKADLSFDEEALQENPLALKALAQDMAHRGFYLTQDRRTKKLRLYSNEGELHASTNKGVVYTLQFGEVFQGGEEEVEVGLEAEKKKDEEQNAEKNKDKDKDSEGKQPNRYLFVTTAFDETFIGARPEEPEKPEGIEEEQGADAGQPKKKAKSGTAPEIKPGASKTNPSASGEKPDDSGSDADESKQDENCPPGTAADDDADPPAEPAEGSDEKQEDKDAKKGESEKAEPAEKNPEGKTAEKPDAPAAQPAKKSKEELKKEYDDKVKKYESDLKAFNEKVEAGQKLVDELNTRFADWYYVISAESFNKLHMTRKELVKEKDKPADDKKPEAPKTEDTDPGADETGDEEAESKPGDDPFTKESAKKSE